MKRIYFLLLILIASLAFYIKTNYLPSSQPAPHSSNIDIDALPDDGESELGPRMEAEFASYELPPKDQIHLIHLLLLNDYTKLEYLIGRYFQAFSRDVKYEGKVIGAFDVFGFEPDILEELDEWVNRHPNSAYARLARGAAYSRLGWNARGKKYAPKTLEDQFKGMRSYFDEAEEDIKHSLMINPNLSPGYVLMIKMAAARGLKKEKLYWYREGINYIPHSYNIRWTYFYHLLPRWNGSYELMENFVERAQTHSNKNPRLLLLKAYIPYFMAGKYSGNGDYEKALLEVTKSINFVKRWFNYYSRALKYKKVGENELALRDINAALKARPDAYEALLVKGLILKNLGFHKEALELYKHAINLYPNHNRMYAYRASVYWRIKEYKKAHDDFTKAISLNPKNAYAWKSRGKLNHYHLNNTKQAIVDLTRAMGLKANPDTWHELSAVLWYSKDPNAAESFRSFLILCETEECKREQVNWARKFVECIDGEVSCSLPPKQFSEWVN